MTEINKTNSGKTSLIDLFVKVFNNPTIMGPVIGFVVFIVFALLMYNHALNGFENTTLEWRFKYFHGEAKASTQCVVLSVDDESVKPEHLGHWPWKRDVYAELIEAVTFYGAKTLSFDIFYPHPFEEKTDQIFVDKVASADNVIIATSIVNKSRDHITESLQEISSHLQPFALQVNSKLEALSAKDIFKQRFSKKELEGKNNVFFPLKPFDKLLQVVKYLGLVNTSSDDSKNITTPLFVEFDGFYYPSLALSTYLVSRGESSLRSVPGGIGLSVDKYIPTVKQNQYVVNWYPAVRKGFPYMAYPVYHVINAYRALQRVSAEHGIPVEKIQDSIDYYYENSCDQKNANCDSEKIAYKLLMDDETDYEFERKDLKDKYIFVGVFDTSAGTKDNVKTPLIDMMPGVFMHANILDNILQGDFIKKTSTRDNLIVMLILCILTCVTILRAKNPVVGIGLAFMYCLYFVIPVIMFDRFNIWLDLFYVEAATIVSFVVALAYQYKVADKGKHEMRKLFSNYLSPQILNEVTSDAANIKLGGNRKEISILFSDIRGFTSISEQSTPEGVVEFLNEYFDEMVEAILKTDGTIDKFIGDAVMAFWGAPVEHEDHAELAIKGALNMVEALRKLKKRWVEEGKDYPEIDIGIGINTGDAIVGNVGSSRIKSYTVIGDSVNLASRLEGLNKNYPPQSFEEKSVLISEYTYCKVKDKFDVQYLGEDQVKGKLQKVKIYRVLGIKKENKSEQ